MTKSTITRERLEKIKSWRETYGAGSNVMLPAEEAEELACLALAALDSEPVAGEARFKEERPRWTPCTAEHVSMVLANPEDWPNYEVRYLYAAPQPAPVVPRVTCWSCRNQVEISAIGDCDGYCPECDASIDLDEEPYTSEQPAPVVPDESYLQLSDLYHAQEKRLFKIAQRIKGPAFDKYSHSPSQAIDVLEAAIFGEDDASHAAMLQAEHVTTDNKLPFEQWLSQQTGAIDVECGCVMTEVFFHWLRVAYEAGNSPVIPEVYVLVPKEPTEKMLISGLEEANPLGGLIDWDASRGDCNTRAQVQGIFKAMLAAAPQEVKGE